MLFVLVSAGIIGFIRNDAGDLVWNVLDPLGLREFEEKTGLSLSKLLKAFFDPFGVVRE